MKICYMSMFEVLTFDLTRNQGAKKFIFSGFGNYILQTGITFPSAGSSPLAFTISHMFLRGFVPYLRLQLVRQSIIKSSPHPVSFSSRPEIMIFLFSGFLTRAFRVLLQTPFPDTRSIPSYRLCFVRMKFCKYGFILILILLYILLLSKLSQKNL